MHARLPVAAIVEGLEAGDGGGGLVRAAFEDADRAGLEPAVFGQRRQGALAKPAGIGRVEKGQVETGAVAGRLLAKVGGVAPVDAAATEQRAIGRQDLEIV